MLAYELRKRGLAVVRQAGVVVRYDGVVVGEYTTDLLVEEALLVVLKAVKALDSVHLAQCLNYLKATDPRRCLLLNFGKPRLEIKRVVHGLKLTLFRGPPTICIGGVRDVENETRLPP